MWGLFHKPWNKYIYIGVSENSGTPKSSILIGFSIINHPIWGTPIFAVGLPGCIQGLRWELWKKTRKVEKSKSRKVAAKLEKSKSPKSRKVAAKVEKSEKSKSGSKTRKVEKSEKSKSGSKSRKVRKVEKWQQNSKSRKVKKPQIPGH